MILLLKKCVKLREWPIERDDIVDIVIVDDMTIDIVIVDQYWPMWWYQWLINQSIKPIIEKWRRGPLTWHSVLLVLLLMTSIISIIIDDDDGIIDISIEVLLIFSGINGEMMMTSIDISGIIWWGNVDPLFDDWCWYYSIFYYSLSLILLTEVA